MAKTETWTCRLKGKSVPPFFLLLEKPTTNFALQSTVRSINLEKSFIKTFLIVEVLYLSLSETPNADVRIGGRTAWSTIAMINDQQYPARFWYDGAYIEQAREDAAEVAYLRLEHVRGDACRNHRN